MIFDKYSNSIKTRLITNVILIHVVLIGIVIFDMLQREKSFMNEQLSLKGYDITSILASSVGTSLLNNDIVALNESISEMGNISNNYMVFILDKSGKVRASTPKEYFNTTLSDPISVSLINTLNNSSDHSYQHIHPNLIDTMTKILVNGRTIGYARTLLDSQSLSDEFKIITQKGLFFILFASLLGALFAWLSVRKMTENLNHLTEAVHELSQQNFKVTLPKIKQKDEVSLMVQAFSVMQKSLHRYIEKIDKNEKRLKLALEGSSDGLWDWNLITNEVYYSPRFKEMIGYKEDEFKNDFDCWKNSLHPADVDPTINFLNDFLKTDTTLYEQRFRMIKKDKTVIPILARGKKIYDESGKVVRLIGTHVDMSEIIKVQDSLKYQAEHDYLTDLPNRVLFNDRLQQAIRHAKRNNDKLAVLF